MEPPSASVVCELIDRVVVNLRGEHGERGGPPERMSRALIVVSRTAVRPLADSTTAGQWRQARTIGLTTEATLLAIDLVYVPKGRIAKTYLVDPAMEAAWLLAWSRASDVTD